MLVSEIPALREYWYPIAYSSAIGTEPFPFTLFGEDFVAWRGSEGGPLQAGIDECPHRGARLSQGWVADGCLVCPYHGWRFADEGRCVEIPANDPSTPVPPRARLGSVHAAERYGLAWVCIDEPRAGIPDLGEADEPGYTIVHEMMEVWDASAPRIIDNALDVSHVAWVHRASVGTTAAPRLGEFEVERDGARLTFSVTITARVNEQQKRNTGILTDFTQRTTHAELVQPLVFRGALVYHDNGLVHVLYKTATPIDDRRTLFCQFVARNDAPDEEKQRGIVEIDRLVQSEDRRLLEQVNPEFPVSITTEVHTKSDRMTVEYRRILGELAAESGTCRADREWYRLAEVRS